MRIFPHIVIPAAFLLSVSLASCHRDEIIPKGPPGSEIVLTLDDDIVMESTTKTTAVTVLPSSLYWGMTTTGGSVLEPTALMAVVFSKISTGRYQTVPPTTYVHYVSNVNFTAGGNLVALNNDTDIVVGKVSSDAAEPTIKLNHIFARLGDLTIESPKNSSGQHLYGIREMSWSIKSKGAVSGVAGTFSLASMTWTSSSSPLSYYYCLYDDAMQSMDDMGQFDTSPGAYEPCVVTSDWVEDIYLLPGEYSVEVSFYMVRDLTTIYYQQKGDVVLTAGKVNCITATTFSDDTEQIAISCSVLDWGESFPVINVE